jgi:DHA2 family methylenomycin A resistance protein-like MFS transporter
MWPIWGALITAGLAEIVLILVERRTSSPMLPLELFFINLFFQQIRGYSPLLAGLALLPETGVIWLADGLSGRVTAHTGPRFPMIVGSLIGAAGFLSMCLTDATTPRDQPRWNGKLQDDGMRRA